MQKIARGRWIGSSSVTASSGYVSPSAGMRSPEARRSRTVPEPKATTSSPRTSPAMGSPAPGGRNVARRMAPHPTDARRTPAGGHFRDRRSCPMMRAMDSGAIKAAAAASTATYRSFADATRSVLDLLARLVPDVTLYLAHLDRQHDVHRIVDVRAGAALGIHSNQASELHHSFDLIMAEDRAPRVCNDVAVHPLYGAVEMQERVRAGSYLGVPLELSDGA